MIKPATASLERTLLVILYKMFLISSLIQFRKNNERLNMVRNVAETKAKQNKTTENFSWLLQDGSIIQRNVISPNSILDEQSKLLDQNTCFNVTAKLLIFKIKNLVCLSYLTNSSDSISSAMPHRHRTVGWIILSNSEICAI